MKIAVFDTSWLRNVQYDIDSGVQALEADDVEELQSFMRQHRSEASRPSRRGRPEGRPPDEAPEHSELAFHRAEAGKRK